DEWGLAGERVVLRGDGEPALQALLKAVAARRKGPTSVEVSPPGDHAANGAAEQGVRLAQGYARTLLAGLAVLLGVDDLPANSVLVPWAVRHGGWLYTRFAERHDGGTAWEGLHQKAYRGALAEFGEKVLHLRPDADRGSKLAQRFAPGLFLGREERTGRYLIATPKGVVRSEQFMRLPVEEAFDRRFLDALHGVPWDAAAQLGLSPDEAAEEPEPPAVVPAELPAPRPGRGPGRARSPARAPPGSPPPSRGRAAPPAGCGTRACGAGAALSPCTCWHPGQPVVAPNLLSTPRSNFGRRLPGSSRAHARGSGSSAGTAAGAAGSSAASSGERPSCAAVSQGTPCSASRNLRSKASSTGSRMNCSDRATPFGVAMR
ncbi:MAG: hypothetical protein QF618_04505, partial [SAR324 cluster bacterium]|nr:hypothetical protein [SAR324 cluster bacterium]